MDLAKKELWLQASVKAFDSATASAYHVVGLGVNLPDISGGVPSSRKLEEQRMLWAIAAHLRIIASALSLWSLGDELTPAPKYLPRLMQQLEHILRLKLWWQASSEVNAALVELANWLPLSAARFKMLLNVAMLSNYGGADRETMLKLQEMVSFQLGCHDPISRRRVKRRLQGLTRRTTKQFEELVREFERRHEPAL